MLSRTRIDDMLYNLHKEAESTGNRYANWAEYAIRRYVLTGRASTPWLKAFMKASSKRFLNRIIKDEIVSDSDVIKLTHKYLHRYCGLDQIPA